MLNVTVKATPKTIDMATDTLDNANVAIDSYTINDYKAVGIIAISLSDLPKRTMRFLENETLKLTELPQKTLSRIHSETVEAGIAWNRNITANRSESIKINDIRKYAFKFHQIEKAITTDKQGRIFRRSVKENISINEFRIMGIRKAEVILLNDMQKHVYHAKQGELLYAHEQLINKLTMPHSESVKIGESYSRIFNANRVFQSGVSISEFYRRNIAVNKTEKLSIDSKVIKSVKLKKAEQFKTIEVYSKKSNIQKKETLLNGILMRPQTFFDRFITENIQTLEMQNKAVYEHFREIIYFNDDKSLNFGKKLNEIVKSIENNGRKWIVSRDFTESIFAKDDLLKSINLKNDDEIKIRNTRILPNPCGILSDVLVRENEMDMSDFESIVERASGYNAFSPFRVGDYEYKDAMYRIRISKTGGTANPLIYDYKVHVDIDDVKDRGTADIPAEETRVYFNRNYYTEPDVVVNVVSGIEGKVIIPFIISTDGEDDKGRYFTIILKDTSGNPVEGTISWNSNGY